MKINHHKTKSKLVATIGILMVALLMGGIYLFYSKSLNNQKDNSSLPTINLQPASEEEKKAGDNTKSSIIESDNASAGSVKNPDPSGQPEDPSNLRVQTSASAQNGNTYQLRYLIESVLSNGTCTLTLKKDSTIITKTANIQALAQTSTCQGFDIPTSELASGTWEVALVVTGENKTGSTSSTIRVQ